MSSHHTFGAVFVPGGKRWIHLEVRTAVYQLAVTRPEAPVVRGLPEVHRQALYLWVSFKTSNWPPPEGMVFSVQAHRPC